MSRLNALVKPCRMTDEAQGRGRLVTGYLGLRQHHRSGRTQWTMPQLVVADLMAMVDVAEQGIVSKAIVENEHHKIVHFTLAAGQELSEHTASVPAAYDVLQGRGTVLAGRRRARGSAGDALLHAGRTQARRCGRRRARLPAHDVPHVKSGPPSWSGAEGPRVTACVSARRGVAPG